ncbi:OXA1_1 [Blepharisma stoltei]|uniref:Membrane insertase YidC/Oxa/ALB C-terminal domain-containing protein n=1 Tax=Blepharisma stoltei TaxID=1481888 RepID=A0AAU9IFR5_9CILI|nr:unnamed protein product [Blepharisma stoltei]
MIRIRALTRSFSIIKHEGSLIDFYLNSVPGPGLTPALAEYTELPSTGLFSGFYEAIRDFSIDSFMYINSMGYGIGFGIIALSVGFRLLYSPIILWAQVIALKTKMLAPEMSIYNRDTAALIKSGNTKQLQELKNDFLKLKRSYGIRNDVQFYSLTQAPFLFSFFFTLKNLTNSPENFPSLLSDGFLWFSNLAIPDPYYILPISISICNYLSIKNSTAIPGMYGPLAKNLKYFAFLGIPVSMTMPSAIVLNWFIMSFFQLIINSLVYTKTGRKIIRIPEVLPGSLQDKLSKKLAAQNLKTIDFSKKNN